MLLTPLVTHCVTHLIHILLTDLIYPGLIFFLYIFDFLCGIIVVCNIFDSRSKSFIDANAIVHAQTSSVFWGVFYVFKIDAFCNKMI